MPRLVLAVLALASSGFAFRLQPVSRLQPQQAATCSPAVTAAPTAASIVRMQQYYGGGGPPRLGGGGPGFNLESLIGPGIFAALFFSGALGWLFNFVIGIQLFLFFIPVLGVPLFQWYVRQNLLEGTCPTCSVEVSVFKGQTNQCMECGSIYTSELVNGVFLRQPGQTGEGVIEVDFSDDSKFP